MRPLNEELYRLLQLEFGRVEIANPGEHRTYGQPMLCSSDTVAVERSRPVRQVGEMYRVSCPFCGDTRQRLYISAWWGVWDDVQQTTHFGLVRCWHQECFEENSNRKLQLWDRVFGIPGRQVRSLTVRDGRVRPVHQPGSPAPSPGVEIPLLELPSHHPAITYLRGRQFDPDYLGLVYRLSFCVEAAAGMRFTGGRLIIPLYDSRGTRIWWQSRYIGDPPRGVPKYASCPGVPKAALGYNFDRAVRHQTIVIVEGPADVWRTGPWALGLLGKSVTPQLSSRLCGPLKSLRIQGVRPTVVLMLDPKQDAVALAKGRAHHMDTARDRLQAALGNLRVPVLPVWLPPHLDPGSAERSFLLDRIREEAKKAAVAVSFTKPRLSSRQSTSPGRREVRRRPASTTEI